MIISDKVAYRFYSLKSGKKAILFNVVTRKFIILDGLSAELLEILVDNDQGKLHSWMETNEISQSDLDEFVEELDLNYVWKHETSFSSINSFNEPNFYLQGDENDNRYLLNSIKKELYENNLYYTFHVDLTNKCNERCIHCYHPFDKYDYSSEMTFEAVKVLIDTIYRMGVFSVTLSGGESLLRNDFFDILKYISDKGLLVSLYTNGILLTDNVVKELSKYRINNVSISIYGDTSELHDSITNIKGSFDKTLQGINQLKKYQIPFNLKCVILRENIDHIENIRSFLKSLNNGEEPLLDFTLCGKLDGDCSVYNHKACYEQIQNVFHSDPSFYIGAKENYTRGPNDFPCGAGRSGLYCSADGKIYPCVSFRLFLCDYTNLLEIHHNSILQKWLQTRISDFTDCFKHDYCQYCTEQCAGNNMIENNDYLNSHVSHCEYAKIIYNWFNNRKKQI